MHEYKTIKISKFPAGEYKNNLAEIFASFPKEDIYFDVLGDELLLSVRQLDFLRFQKHFALADARSNNGLGGLLKEIVKSVESVRSYGLNGNKRLYVGYNREKKVKNRKGKVHERGGCFYTRGENFSKSDNEMPERFINKIITGDSELTLKKFPDNSVDIIFTSPPYNFGLDYENHKDGTDWSSYFDKLFAVFKECVRVLKYGGRIVVNVQPLFSDYIPIHHIISDFFMKQKMIWRGEILWDKHNWNCKYTAWGSWKSPSNPYLKYTWEFLEIFCKGDLKKTGKKENIDISADEFKKLVVAKWDIAPERNMKDYGHPAMFPENLAGNILKLFSYKGDIVLDPFNGVGTTTAVAKKLGRRYIGIDISEEYCKKAQQRLECAKIGGLLRRKVSAQPVSDTCEDMPLFRKR
ncbi:MAG: site-specific DNA-methyltransferase [Elusimicrobia bacterium]|nr:site-specific DNA-methyltransferase [Elusimicrobiota bacterium]